MLGPRREVLAGARDSAVDGVCITATGTVRWCVSLLAESLLGASIPGAVSWCASLLTEALLGAPTPGASSVWSMSWSALDGVPAGCCVTEGVGNSRGCPLRMPVSMFVSVCGIVIWKVL